MAPNQYKRHKQILVTMAPPRGLVTLGYGAQSPLGDAHVQQKQSREQSLSDPITISKVVVYGWRIVSQLKKSSRGRGIGLDFSLPPPLFFSFFLEQLARLGLGGGEGVCVCVEGGDAKLQNGSLMKTDMDRLKEMN